MLNNMDKYTKVDYKTAVVTKTVEETVDLEQLLEQKEVCQRQIDSNQNEINSNLAKIADIQTKIDALTAVGIDGVQEESIQK